MTVRELTEVLTQIPDEYQNLEVVDTSYERIMGIWELYDGYPVIVPDKENCEYRKVIRIVE